MHKNLSSRLGVTLGYDEKSEDSNIYVVEVGMMSCIVGICIVITVSTLQILPDGIAAQDARLQVGDIITKVGLNLSSLSTSLITHKLPAISALYYFKK